MLVPGIARGRYELAASWLVDWLGGWGSEFPLYHEIDTGRKSAWIVRKQLGILVVGTKLHRLGNIISCAGRIALIKRFLVSEN